jgi:hypothetical protein
MFEKWKTFKLFHSKFKYSDNDPLIIKAQLVLGNRQAQKLKNIDLVLYN